MNEPESNWELGKDNTNDLFEKKDIDGLINILKYGKKWQLINAMCCLGALKDDKAIDPLLEVASTYEGGMRFRQNAVRALGAIGNPKVIEPIIYLMGKHEYLHGAGAEAFGMLKAESAVKLLNMMMNDKTEVEWARSAAAVALCKIGTQEAIKDVVAVLNSDIGESASFALKQLGEAALQSLISAHNYENEAKIVEILGEMVNSKYPAQALYAILESKIIEGSPNLTDTLSETVRALVKINDDEIITKTIGLLVNALKPDPLLSDADYAFQCHLIMALGETRDKRVIKPLVNVLLGASEARPVYSAAYSLAMLGSKIDDPAVIQQLIGFLGRGHKNEPARDFIAWALLQTDEEVVAVPLIEYLKDNCLKTLKDKLFQEYEAPPSIG